MTEFTDTLGRGLFEVAVLRDPFRGKALTLCRDRNLYTRSAANFACFRPVVYKLETAGIIRLTAIQRRGDRTQRLRLNRRSLCDGI